MSLRMNINITNSRQYQLQQDYLAITSEDMKIMSDYKDLFIQKALWVVEAFYNHILKYTHLKIIIEKNTTITRLKESQKQYFIKFCDPLDENYLQRSIVIGKKHQ